MAIRENPELSRRSEKMSEIKVHTTSLAITVSSYHERVLNEIITTNVKFTNPPCNIVCGRNINILLEFYMEVLVIVLLRAMKIFQLCVILEY